MFIVSHLLFSLKVFLKLLAVTRLVLLLRQFGKKTPSAACARTVKLLADFDSVGVIC